MRIRSIKPEFWSDRKVATWDDFTKLLFIGLWSYADDYGCGAADPVNIACALFPRDMAVKAPVILANVSRALATLAEDGVIKIFEARDEKWFAVKHWTKHQRVDRPSKRSTPTPSDDSKNKARESLASPSRPEQGSRGAEEQGSMEHGAEENGAEEQGSMPTAAAATPDFSDKGHADFLRREVAALPKTLRESVPFAAAWPKWITHLIDTDPKNRRPSSMRLTDHAKTCLEVFKTSGVEAALDCLRFAIRVGKEFPIVDKRETGRKTAGVSISPEAAPATPEAEAAAREANLDHYLPRVDWKPPVLPKAITPQTPPLRAGNDASGAHGDAGAPEATPTASA